MQTNIQSAPPVRVVEVAGAPPTRLPRALGPVMATAIVIGTVIGSGVFKKPQLVADRVPNFGWVALVWILGGVLALLGALALAEVAVLFPKAGGNYVFLREGFGRLFGFLWGWVEFWIIRCASIAALATIFTESLHNVLRVAYGLSANEDLFEYWTERFLTVGVIAVLALVNVRGVKWGGLLQVVITSVKVGSLLAIVVLPFLFWARIDDPVMRTVTTSTTTPAFTFAGLGAAMLGVQWAYHGWMNIAPIAEEVRQPQRNIPLALLAGVGTVIFLYLGANVAYHLVIPQFEMRDLTKTTVAAEFAMRLLGSLGAALASAAVMFSVFGALNGNLLVGPRLLYAMGQDGLAPQGMSRLHPRCQTPALSILVVAAWSCLLVLGGAALAQFPEMWGSLSGNREVTWYILPPNQPLFDVLTDFAMFGAVIFETLAVATIFVFRARLPHAERPYRCWGYPVVPIVYVSILAVVAVATMVTNPVAIFGVGFILLGAAIYFTALRKRPA
jgi:amino acid transporter